MAYHLRHCSEWTIRLGDGTDESHKRMQDALDDVWPYANEMFETDDVEHALIATGIAIDPQGLRAQWNATLDHVFAEATLTRPSDGYNQSGGRNGRHTEHLGAVLAEMQHMQRTYPGAKW